MSGVRGAGWRSVTSVGRLITLASAILVAACGTGTDSAGDYLDLPGGLQGAIHPNEQDRLSATSAVPVVSVSISGSDAELPLELAPLAAFDETAAVGVSAGADDTSDTLEFGSLVDAVFDENGNVFLLDAGRSVVRVLDPSLQPRHSLGSAGAGPGGIAGAQRLFWRGPGELAVSGARRLDAFGVEGEGFRSLGRTPIPSVDFQSDACGFEGRIFVLGVRLEGESPGTGSDSADSENSGISTGQADPNSPGVHPELTHELSPTGEVVRSFSVPYTGTVPVPGHQRRLQSVVGTGALECAAGHVWAGYSVLGEVHSLADDGELEWIVRFSDFDRPGYLFEWDGSGRATGLDFEPGAFDSGFYEERIDRISHLSEELLAVQVTRTERGSDEEGYPETHTHRTYLLDPEDGRFLGGIVGDHQILGGRNGIVILYRESPVPQISITRLEPQ